MSFSEHIPRHFRVKASSGLQAGFKDLFYFYKHLGLFPMVSEKKPTEFSREGAENLARNFPDQLLMDKGHSFRSGDWAHVLLYLPWSWIKGSAEDASARPLMRFLFLSALLFLLFRFNQLGQLRLGAFVVVCLGANPFILYEAYHNHNLFSLPASVGIFAIASFLPLIFTKGMPLLRCLGWAFLWGVIIGFLKLIRTEPTTILVSIAFVFLLNHKLKLWMRFVPIALFLTMFFAAKTIHHSYFNALFEKTTRYVEEVGGHPYKGPIDVYHGIWHPIFVGFSDWDNKYGIKWKDKMAADHMKPLIKERYGVDMPEMLDCCVSDQFIDKAKKYSLRPYEMQEYADTTKSEVFRLVSEDPLWFLRILLMRVAYLLLYSTPIALLFGFALPVQIPTGFAVAYAIYLWRKGQRSLSYFILFPLPLAAVSILIFSKLGTTFYVFSNMLALAVLLSRSKRIESLLKRWTRV